MNRGIVYMILSGLCFIVINFFVKILGGSGDVNIFGELQSYPGHELVLARSVVSFTISFFVIKRRKIPFLGNNRKWLLIRGISGTVGLTIFFYTLHYLPLAIATTVQYLAPIFTVIFAVILLKEKVRSLQWFFIGVSLLGVAFIAMDKLIGKQVIGEEISFLWLGLGMLSAVFSGLAYASIMKLKSTDQPISIVIYFPMISIPTMLIFCMFDFTVPRGIEWLFLLLIGVFTQFAQILLTRALHFGNASIITPFQYIGAIYAFLLGYFVFDETLSPLVEVGIVLILSGVVINALLKRK